MDNPLGGLLELSLEELTLKNKFKISFGRPIKRNINNLVDWASPWFMYITNCQPYRTGTTHKKRKNRNLRRNRADLYDGRSRKLSFHLHLAKKVKPSFVNKVWRNYDWSIKKNIWPELRNNICSKHNLIKTPYERKKISKQICGYAKFSLLTPDPQKIIADPAFLKKKKNSRKSLSA